VTLDPTKRSASSEIRELPTSKRYVYLPGGQEGACAHRPTNTSISGHVGPQCYRKKSGERSSEQVLHDVDRVVVFLYGKN
jgi:hypothetical protein